jgi:transposase
MKRHDARALDHKTLEAIRIRAVQQVQNGESPEVVIRALGFTRACIYNWLAAYRAGGWESLKAKRLYGRPHKLKGSQIRWIYRTVTSKNPLQLKFPFALWTRGMIRTLIWRQYRLKLSEASVGRLLAQLGLSCQRPLAKAFEQNRSLVEQWVKKEYPRIRAWAKRQGAEILFADESGVRSDFHAGTTWAPIGQTPVVRQTGQRFSLNMISAVSPKGQLRFMVTPKRISASVFVEFLKRLMHGWKKRIFLIVDGHPTHKARVVKTYLEKVDGKLRLFYLPPYSPELNPDEYVWNDVKNNAIGRSVIVNAKNLRSIAESRLRYLQKNAAHVRTFFQSETTRYAA